MFFDMVRIEMLTGEQIRMALAGLRLTQKELSDLSGLSVPTVQRLADADGLAPGRLPNVMKLKDALEARGAVFGGDGSVRIERNPR